MNNFPSIEDLYSGKSGSKKTQSYIHSHYPEFEKYISDNFSFCDSWIEKLYCYFNSIDKRPVCKECGSLVKFHGFNYGYSDFCSTRCSNKSKTTKDKIKISCLEKYGVENPFQSDAIKNKIKQTNLEKYGVDNPAKSQSSKTKHDQTMIRKYGSLSYNNYDKYKQTCLEKYGVENPFQSDVIKNKIEQTNLEKYGVKNPVQSDVIKDKIKQTNLKKYGVGNPFQSNEIKDKIKQTNLEKYDVEYALQSQEFQNKVKQTCLERYGEKHFINKEKAKQTCLERYGVASTLQVPEIRELGKQTCLERYGAEYPIQSKEIQNKIYNTKKKNHTFNTSQIEKDFESYLKSRNIEYKPQYRSELYPFNCDFYISEYDLYIEIQAGWFHGHHPYDPESDKEILETWKTKNTKYYDNAIETWTIRDVKKRNIAKRNGLNYLEIFSNNINEVIKQFENYILNNF